MICVFPYHFTPLWNKTIETTEKRNVGKNEKKKKGNEIFLQLGYENYDWQKYMGEESIALKLCGPLDFEAVTRYIVITSWSTLNGKRMSN